LTQAAFSAIFGTHFQDNQGENVTLFRRSYQRFLQSYPPSQIATTITLLLILAAASTFIYWRFTH
jgi:hypothetical protein